MASWSFLTNYARVLLCIAHDPGVRLRDIGRQDAERALGGLRASMQREREETAARLAAALEAAQAGAELERVRADSTREREELRQVLDGRASVLEESRAELRARAERAERELDSVRAELAELGRA